MRTNLLRPTIVGILILSGNHGYSQGTFANLNFENSIITWDPSQPGEVPIANALPGWTGYLGGQPTVHALYNTVSLGDAAISLQGPGSVRPAIEGSYSVILQPSSAGFPTSAALAQTGQIPSWARSLLYDGGLVFQVSFDGQRMPIIPLSGHGDYFLVGADISGFAGQTGELKFLVAPQQFGVMGYLDNIQFSPEPLPEPSTLCLFGFGALLLGWRFRCKRT